MANTNEDDALQQGLEEITNYLASPAFLSTISASRLPSAAVSDSSSLSPTRLAPAELTRNRRSTLNIAATFHDVLEDADLISPLIQEPCADGSDTDIDKRVVEHLNEQFLWAHNAYANMAAERTIQPFAHGHQDLVLAIDFNYFGTRMVTASSDHRLKVWDKKDDAWTLVESWKAHDAEIVDVSYQSSAASPGSDACMYFATVVPFTNLTSGQMEWTVHG